MTDAPARRPFLIRVLIAREGKMGWLGLIIPALILWNPIIPIGFTREEWVAPDLVAAVAFGVLAAATSRHKRPSATPGAPPPPASRRP